MKKIRKNLKLITVIVVMIILVILAMIKFALSSDVVEQMPIDDLVLDEEVEVNDENGDEADVSNVFVDIKGAVISPGVYEIENNKKVIDVVQLAGGLLENADTSMVNLAKKVTNEMVIIIYTVDEVRKAMETEAVAKIVDNKCVCPKVTNDACLKQNSTSTSNNDNLDDNVSNEGGIVNINTATIEELLTLSGIGESKAKAIVEYREDHGDFKKIEDVMEVSGIGEALYEKIKEHITV